MAMPRASLDGPGGEALPGAIAGHAGGVGSLAHDQHHIGRAVVVEAGSHRQHASPVVARHQLGERGLELAVQLSGGGRARNYRAEATRGGFLSLCREARPGGTNSRPGRLVCGLDVIVRLAGAGTTEGSVTWLFGYGRAVRRPARCRTRGAAAGGYVEFGLLVCVGLVTEAHQPG